MIADKKEFYGGLALLIGFVVVLVIIFSPVFKGQNGLEYLDDLYNSISKGSAYYIPKVKKEMETFVGTSVGATIAMADDLDDIDAKNTKLVALKGSTSQAFVEEAIPEATLVTAKSYDEAVKMVLEDKVHAMVADYPICVISVFRYPNQGLLSVVTQLTYEPIGAGLPAGDPLLVNWVENFMGIAAETGLLEELKRKWLLQADWLYRLP
jgi:ABC-type amino acid transport substrate-binding protein